MSPEKKLPNIAPYPFDAQANPFFCALASALLPALSLTEEMPYFCGMKNSVCVQCGGCGKKTTLQERYFGLFGVGPKTGYKAPPGVEKGKAVPYP